MYAKYKTKITSPFDARNDLEMRNAVLLVYSYIRHSPDADLQFRCTDRGGGGALMLNTTRKCVWLSTQNIFSVEL